jgi:hypothetical protein
VLEVTGTTPVRSSWPVVSFVEPAAQGMEPKLVGFAGKFPPALKLVDVCASPPVYEKVSDPNRDDCVGLVLSPHATSAHATAARTMIRGCMVVREFRGEDGTA